MALTIEQVKRIIEAALFYANEPMSLKQLAEVFNEEDDVNVNAVQDILGLIKDDYQLRGVELIEVASGFRFQVCADLSDWITRLMTEKPARYSRALLETLALIAYKQPITRAEIEEVRGVSVSSNIIRTLEEREWIKVIGHRDVPGKPALFATTKHFLNDMNLTSLSQLPTLAEIQDLDDGQLTQQLQLSLGDDQKTGEVSGAEQDEDPTQIIAQTEDVNEAEQVEQLEKGHDEQLNQGEQLGQDSDTDYDEGLDQDDDSDDHTEQNNSVDEENEHAELEAYSSEDDTEQHIIETTDDEHDETESDEDEDLDDSLDMILEEIYEDG